jgi:hypothetical protein
MYYLQAVLWISGKVHRSDCVLGMCMVGSRGVERAVWCLTWRRVGRSMGEAMEERAMG